MGTFIKKPLGGNGFFEAVRTSMAATGDWLFAGQDEDLSLNYVVMDALFYGMETIIRPDGSGNPDFNQGFPSAQTFTGYAMLLTGEPITTIPRFRVVVNGNFYDSFAYNKDKAGPNHWWKGQVYKAGKFIDPPAKSPKAELLDLYYIGRNGQRTGRYRCENKKIKPSDFNLQHPNSKLTHAMGGLSGMIQDKAIVDTLKLDDFQRVGKTIVGYHKKTESLFVVTQQQARILGSYLSEIAKSLRDAGADAALQCDGSSSSALIVDGVIATDCVEVWGARYKDFSTPNGLAFKLADLKLGGPKSSLNVPGVPADLPNFDGSIRATAAIALAKGKLTLTIRSFGSSPGNSPESIATKLSIPGVAIPSNPLNLEAIAPNNIDLRSDVTFKAIVSPGKSVQCVAKLDKSADVDAMGGTVKIQDGSTIKTGSFFWPILT